MFAFCNVCPDNIEYCVIATRAIFRHAFKELIFELQNFANVSGAILYLPTMCPLNGIMFVDIKFANKECNCDWRGGVITWPCSNVFHY